MFAVHRQSIHLDEECMFHPDESAPLLSIGHDWGLWPIAQLRSAGYPAGRLLAFIAEAEKADRDSAQLRALVEEYARDPWLFEALCWQNPTIVNTWLRRYAVDGAGAGGTGNAPAQYRRKLLALALYIQRYATKNETIGFFGPFGWARLDPSSDCLVQVRADGSRTKQHTEFEHWVMAALADRWAADPEVRWHLPLRLSEAGALHGNVFVRPRRGALQLDAEQQAVLAAVADGVTVPEEVLATLRGQYPALADLDRAELTTILDGLQRSECLWWGFHLPVVLRPDRLLREQLEALPAGPLRSGPVAQLDRLSSLRHAVTRAAGDPLAVADAMSELVAAFETMTQVRGSVPKSVNPDSRGLLFHDTTVDWDATLGARAIAGLRGPLELLMAVCRYITWRIAGKVEDLARTVLAGEQLSFEDVFYELLPELDSENGGRIARAVVGEVHARIADLLGRPDGAGEFAAAYQAAELREAWLDAFAAPGPGWSAARLHSPDLMLASDGTRHMWVLGELHIAMNPLDYEVCLDSQPTAGELESLVDAATNERFIPAFPVGWPRITARTYPPPATDLPGKHRYWTLWSRSVVGSSIPRIPAVGLTVEDRPEGVVVLDEQGQKLALLTEFLGEFLSIAYVNAFSLTGDADHRPRILIDDLVVQRQAWRIPVGEFAEALASRDPDAAIRSDLTVRGVPRYSFVRIPGQPKPVFCDSGSTLMLGNIVRMLRKTRVEPNTFVRFQEMLPGLDQTWLEGPKGKVCSEFRLVFQDLLPESQRTAPPSPSQAN
jgi:hypothetical protein